MEHDMIEPSPELAESAAKFEAVRVTRLTCEMMPYERMLRERIVCAHRPGFDSNQHCADVRYLLNLLDRERR